MRIGTSNMLPWKSHLSQAEIIQQGIERMVRAEELGFDGAWLTEHHFGNDPNYHPFGLEGSDQYRAYDLSADPLTILSHVAAKTTRLRLGTGVVVLHFDDPLRVAERAALVDIMSDGRLEFGVGRGGGHREPATFKVPKDPKANRDKFGEAVDILQLAWTGKPFSYEGQFYQVPEVIVTPKPVQDPFPLYVAGSSADSFAWVGGRGLPYCYAGGAHGRSGWEKYTGYTEAYQSAVGRTGVDTSKFLYPQVVYAYCADTDEEAEEVTRHHLMEQRRFSEGHYENRRYGGGSGAPDQSADLEQTFKDAADDVIIGDVIGSPETCIRKMKAYCDFFKPNYLLLSISFGLIPQDLVLKSMERLSRYVLPAFANERELVTA